MIIFSSILALIVIIGAVFGTTMVRENSAQEENKTTKEVGERIVGGAVISSGADIVENFKDASNLTTFNSAIQIAELKTSLRESGPFTVFAPTDTAFNELPVETRDDLLRTENKNTLQEILKYHIVSGKYLTSELVDGQVLTTLQGQDLKISKTEDKLLVDNVEVSDSDVEHSNGISHLIDNILEPDLNPTVGGTSMLRSKNIVENTSSTPNLTSFVASLKAAELTEALEGVGPFTVFVPDNDAFSKLPNGVVDNLLKPENKQTLTSFLTYHVVQGKYLLSDFTDDQQLTTLNGEKLTIIAKDSLVSVKSETPDNVSVISTPNVIQSNGIVHIVDTPLLPRS